MAIGYIMGAWSPLGFRPLILFAILVKILATLFLTIYWLGHPSLTVVLLSGIGDGIMAGVLALLYRHWRDDQTAKESE